MSRIVHCVCAHSVGARGFTFSKMQQNGEELVLPPALSRRILCRSFATMICSSVAICFGRPAYATVSIGTMVLSINYWRRPVVGSWRRRADVAWLLVGFTYQAARACAELRGLRALAYWTLVAATIGCYARARALGAAGRGDLDSSSRWHSRIHVVGAAPRRLSTSSAAREGNSFCLGNVANCVLYVDPAASWAAVNAVYCPLCICYWCAVHLALMYSQLLDTDDPPEPLDPDADKPNLPPDLSDALRARGKSFKGNSRNKRST